MTESMDTTTSNTLRRRVNLAVLLCLLTAIGSWAAAAVVVVDGTQSREHNCDVNEGAMILLVDTAVEEFGLDIDTETFKDRLRAKLADCK